jgi:hypothetical protein
MQGAGDTMTDDALTSVRTNGYDPRCKSCNDPNHEEYDKDYFSGKINKSEYARLVGCSIPSVTRHIENHVPKDLVVATEARAVTKADDLLSQISYYETEARRYKEMAEADGNVDLALKAVDRALKCVEIYAKVRGIINDQPQVNILVNPQWIELKAVIVAALRPYPDALEAVRDALR